MRGQTHAEEHREFMALLLLMVFAAVALIVGCDSGSAPPVTPTPVVVVTPTPRPTAAPAAAPSCYWIDNPSAAKAKCVFDTSPGFFVSEMEEGLHAMLVLHPEFFRKIEIEELMPNRIGDAGDFLEDWITAQSRGLTCAAYRLGADDEIDIKGDNARSERIDWLMGDLRLRHRGHVWTCSPSAF